MHHNSQLLLTDKLGDLDLWPMTLTFELIWDMVKVNVFLKSLVRMSDGSVVRELTDAQTDRQTDMCLTDRQTGPIPYPRPLTLEGMKLSIDFLSSPVRTSFTCSCHAPELWAIASHVCNTSTLDNCQTCVRWKITWLHMHATHTEWCNGLDWLDKKINTGSHNGLDTETSKVRYTVDEN